MEEVRGEEVRLVIKRRFRNAARKQLERTLERPCRGFEAEVKPGECSLGGKETFIPLAAGRT
jgi:hypothetical protein